MGREPSHPRVRSHFSVIATAKCERTAGRPGCVRTSPYWLRESANAPGVGWGLALGGDGLGLEGGVGAGADLAAVDLLLADQPEGQAGADQAEDPAEHEDLVEAVEEPFFGRA